MAEFCLECWNKISDMSLTEKDVIISKDFGFCEECNQTTKLIEMYERKNFLIRLFWRTFHRIADLFD